MKSDQFNVRTMGTPATNEVSISQRCAVIETSGRKVVVDAGAEQPADLEVEP